MTERPLTDKERQVSAAFESPDERAQRTIEALKNPWVGVATCNYKCSNLQSRHFQTRIICNYNYAERQD